MKSIVLRNIRERFGSLADIAGSINQGAVGKHLDVTKNKSVGEHMWCVVGARESYAKAIVAGGWAGFACSLATTDNLADIREKLVSSAVEFEEAISSVQEWTDEHDELLLRLLEHEATHEAQLIRHLFGLGEAIPASVKWA